MHLQNRSMYTRMYLAQPDFLGLSRSRKATARLQCTPQALYGANDDAVLPKDEEFVEHLHRLTLQPESVIATAIEVTHVHKMSYTWSHVHSKWTELA